MNSVYDVIEVLRVWHGLTMKELAARASVSYTTLATFMNRRPEKIAKNTLVRIASVFRAEWYELLMLDSPSGPAEPYRGRNLNGERVSSMMPEASVESVLRSILGDHYEEAIDKCEKQQNRIHHQDQLPQRHQDWEERQRQRNHQLFANDENAQRNKLRRQLGMCVDFAFDNLNDDGVIEAMRYIFELAQNPKYKKTKERNGTEETEWQKEKLPMAAEPSD